jgi:hypothetical protein
VRVTTLIGLLLFGLLMWSAEAVDMTGESPLLWIGLLLAGGIQAVWAGFVPLNSRPSGRLAHSQEQMAGFCLCCGIGLASIGLAISPLTRWLLPAFLFALGGVALIVWAPQGFHRALAREARWRATPV